MVESKHAGARSITPEILSHSSKSRQVFFGAGLAVLAVAILFVRLGSSPLIFDEAIYAEVSKQVLASGELLTLHWNGAPWFEKPPIFIWATALAFRVFGVSEFSARVISALCGVGVVLVSAAIARELYSRAAGVIAGLVMLSSPLFVFFARFGTTDVCLVLFLVLGQYFYIRAAKDPRLWLGVGLAFAGAVLVKGFAAGVGPLSIAVGLVIEGRIGATIKSRHFWRAVVTSIVLAGSWHLAEVLIHGERFWKVYLGLHVVGRATSGSVFGGDRDPAFYFRVLGQGFFPWVLIALPAVLLERNRRAASLIAMAAATLILYSIASTKFPWYLLPMFPPLAIISSGFLSRLKSEPVLVAVVVLLASVGLWRSVRGLHGPARMVPTMVLAKKAAPDAGLIMTAPEDLQDTAIFYSGRRVCTDRDLNPLSFGYIEGCKPGEARNIIFSAEARPLVESRLRVRVLAEERGIFYAEVLP